MKEYLNATPLTPRTRNGLVALATVLALRTLATDLAAGQASLAPSHDLDLAPLARASASFVSGHETITALNSGFDPANSNDKRHGAYGNWPRTGTQWVQYDWPKPICTGKMALYWFNDRRGVHLPTACRLNYWDGERFVPVSNLTGLGLAADRYNTAEYAEITTTKLRLEFDSEGAFSTGILAWKVYDSGKSPNFPPAVSAGVERVVVWPGKTYLNGVVKDDGKPKSPLSVAWSKESGPGEVTFGQAHQAVTTATFSAPGDYVLRLSADDGELSASDTLRVSVAPPPPTTHLEPIHTLPYQLHSRLWNARTKNLIVNWIPHCYNRISDPNLREGGLANFIEAAHKLAGQAAKPHVGYVFANAWVHNTVESMCVALMVDAQGDPELMRAQQAMRAVLDDWIPKILAAQEPDGYLQTYYTLSGRPRWSRKDDHEGYTAGYFIESAIAHYLLTHRKDDPLYRGAKKLADCWYDHIGPPPKLYWYDGHQELEQALVRFARLVDEVEGAGAGRRYVELAKFLLDARRDGQSYDQSHLPVTQQYEAAGHSVRAAYCYSGMADVAMETRDPDYYSAIASLWDNLVNKKYYVTGGIGSGETSEGFGPNYSLPNNAYCESCANCGELYFQHKMNLIYHDAKYADLYEETLYNAILGDVDLPAKNFTYTNPLEANRARYPWHNCPCCVGNIARTLLMLPTWMYAKNVDTVSVNLYLGSSVAVGEVAGTPLQLVQTTEYPWSGHVTITVNPAEARRFTIRLRVPNRQVSHLYASTPAVNGFDSLSLNGSPLHPAVEKGYLAITRTWTAGDKLELVLPMPVQRVKADPKVKADVGRVALRCGPLIYNLESVDQDLDLILKPEAALSTAWKPTLLDGVTVIQGAFANGAPLTAIPNYARSNRGGRSLVWLREQ